MNRILDLTTSFAASGARLFAGLRVEALGPRPERPLELYEFEACPYCRKVREALTALDLDAEIRPCPKRGARFRPFVREHGGKEQFPYLVDPNTGKALYESAEIVRYLFATYGTGAPPLLYAVGPLVDLGAMLASALRPGRGAHAEPSRAPRQPLELWSFEASPFCRIVREKLSTLELPYRLHNLGKSSPGRPAFERRAGRIQVPFLVDPNTNVEMFESSDIVHYLDATYGGVA
ncbi:glutathione S-transferase N-terminal domain-containing protein [Myxococcota bacterium]|nr:glutathione S-transferase N-terminal domain-containing protein [Myxococcota bacterium]MCZ7619479.1 glutathione S-transferase N-terminal domain-containing protein [Myxococcota bacterium]